MEASERPMHRPAAQQIYLCSGGLVWMMSNAMTGSTAPLALVIPSSADVV
jgi:hypothetical protein